MNNLDEKMLAAASNGDLATVEELVKQGANINYTDAWGNCAIFAAAWEGNTKSTGFILRFRSKNII